MLYDIRKYFPDTYYALQHIPVDNTPVRVYTSSITELKMIARTLEDIAKPLQRIFQNAERPNSTEQPQAGSEASPKPCLKCIHNQVCMIAAAALRNSGMDVVVNGCNYMEERTASAVR